MAVRWPHLILSAAAGTRPLATVTGTAQRCNSTNTINVQTTPSPVRHRYQNPSVTTSSCPPNHILSVMSNLRAAPQPRRAPGEQASSAARPVDASASQTDIQTSSLIQLSPRVSRTSESSQKEAVEEEEKRCWICYTSDAEEEAPKSDWKSPCRCTLIAHESCLLEWIADLQRSENNNSGGKIACPQCKTQIRLKQKRSVVLEVVEGAGRAVGKAVPVLILAGLLPHHS